MESKPKFDPEAFLAKADGGVTISKYGKGQAVFAQGDPVDSVFYILSTRVITESFKALAVAETTEILTRPSRNAPWSSGKTTTLADEISGLERSFVSDS